MPEILSKTQYAKRCGVRHNAVSNWIARRKLTPPALRPDGTIDAALADQQLGVVVDVIRQVGQRRRSPSSAPPPTEDPDSLAQRLLRARVVLEEVRAERARRELEAESGRYMLTAEVEAAWVRALTDFLQQIEQSFGDLARELEGLDVHRRRVAIRQWWRGQRQRAADVNRAAIAGLPEFVEDPQVR